MSAKPAVIWLTGLSGAGKTSIAYGLAELFRSVGVVPVMMDGDEIRQAMRLNGFDEESRKMHNLNVGYLSALFERQGHVVIVSLISPYLETRNAVRQLCGNFIEVYLATDLAVCMQRDPKGLYRKAVSGELPEFTGISALYEAPVKPELRVDTADVTVGECVRMIFDYYQGS